MLLRLNPFGIFINKAPNDCVYLFGIFRDLPGVQNIFFIFGFFSGVHVGVHVGVIVGVNVGVIVGVCVNFANCVNVGVLVICCVIIRV